MLLGRASLVALAALAVVASPAACSRGASEPDVGPGAAAGDDGGGQGGAGPEAGEGGALGGSSSGAAGDSSSAGGAGGDVSVAGAGGAGGASSGGSAATCDAVVAEHELAAGVHVAACSEVTYATNPPSSGPHYPVWADFGVYDFPLPRGFWVHNLEHGAVVVSYNCPDGCADEVAAASAWLALLFPDAACPTSTPRVLLVPDPLLDVRWGASAWAFTLRADCFDEAAFTDFYTNYAGHSSAPEAFVCTAGPDLRVPEADTCGAH